VRGCRSHALYWSWSPARTGTAPRNNTTTVLPVARMFPIGPGGLQSGFSTLRYVRRDFRGLPAPPGGPPVLGSLAWRAEGLPSTRNWPFRWPLSRHCHPPARPR
jgi:hypothetical protein